MGILGIPNRTENWKTAQTFAPFMGNQPALRRLVKRLGKPIGEKEKVSLELFWKGGRDWLAQDERRAKKLAKRMSDAYKTCHFHSLREKIKDESAGFRSLKSRNYQIDEESGKKLANHFKNTEFDIVLETSEHLFIGEAKDESGFGTDSRYVLVHQLIRQFVIAQILAHLVAECGEEQPKSIVPFVIGPDEDKKLCSLRKTAQIRFMTKEGYLEENNVLSWKELASLS